MPSVVRSTFVLGVFAFAAATATACGDKVNVTQPPKDSSVQSVLVSPPGPVQMKIGDKVTFAASVTGGPDLTNRAVTWKSSATNIATVDNNGVVTAVSGGTASIIATSVQNTGVSGAAVVTVGASVNATVTISGVNQTTCGVAGCISAPANIAAIMGQIDVTLNVDPGTQTLTGVDLIMNCTGTGNSGTDTVVASQNLGADQAPISAEAASAPVQLSFNTANFNATTGAPAFKNGNCTLKGRARTAAGTQSGSNTEILTLTNPDVIIGTLASTKQAINPNGNPAAVPPIPPGLSWHGGDVTVSAVPVFFTAGRSAASVTIGFEGKSSTIAQGGAQSVTFLNLFNTASTNPLNISGKTDPNSQNTVLVTTIDNSGNSFANAGPAIVTAASFLANPASGGSAPFNATNPFRLDTEKPLPGTIALANNTDQGTTGSGYIGAAFKFTADSSSGFRGPNAIPGNQTQNLDARTLNAGVDNVTVVFQQGTSATSSFTTLTNTANLSETASASTNVLRQITTDALGNADTSYATGAPFPGASVPALAKFGVDKTPPTFALTSGPANQATSQALGGTGNYVVAISDALSGPGVTQLVAQVRLESGVTTTSSLPPNGAVFTNTTENNVAGGGCIIGRFNTTQAAAGANALPVIERGGTTVGFCTPTPYSLGGGTTVAASFGAPPIAGYTTTEIVAIDQAGNTAAPFVNVVLEDATNPTAGPGVDLPQSITGGSAPVFPTIAADNIDVVGSFAQINYPSATLEYAVTPGTGTAFDNVLTRSTTVTPTVSLFARNLANIANPGAATIGTITATAPTSVNIVVLDAASRAGATGNINFSPTVAIPQSSSNPWSSFFTAGFSIAANNASVSNCPTGGCGALPPGTTPAANPTTTTFTATAAGVSGQLGNPFSTVQIWYQPTGGTAWFLAGTTGAGTSRDTGVSGNRFWDFTFTWDPPAKTPADATGATTNLTPAGPGPSTITVNVMAIGLNANGDALFTTPMVITLTNP